MRNSRLRDLPANSWLRLGDFGGREVGSKEVPWCYDSDRRRFIRVGGTENDSNEVWSFDLGSEKWTELLPAAFDPANPRRGRPDRPGYSGGGGICYDRDHRCVWDYSILRPGIEGGQQGLWRGVETLGPEQWTFIKQAPAYMFGCHVAYDEHARKVVGIGRDGSNASRTWVYDPENGQATELPQRPDFSLVGTHYLDTYPGFVYVPDLKGCLLVTRTEDPVKKGTWLLATLLFETSSLTWRDLAPKGPVPSPRWGMGLSYDRKNHVVVLFGSSAPRDKQAADDTWIYDAARNTWTEMKSTTSPAQFYKNPITSPTTSSDCRMLAYDEEHNVHVLVLQNWDKDNAVWAYRHK